MKVDRLVGTDFLIDRWRNGESSGAAAYARAHATDSLAIPWTVKAEFLQMAGSAGQDLSEMVRFLAWYPTHWPDDELLVGYAQLYSQLRLRGVALRGNDLWLAASALRLGVPLVTRSTSEFGKVPGIRVDPY